MALRNWFKPKSPQKLSELIGGAQRVLVRMVNLYTAFATRDWSVADYRFWDKARRCKARGLELSGLFLKPLGSKVAAWVLGDAPTWKSDDDLLESELNKWWGDHHAELLRGYEESVDLGNCYAVINSDLSVTIVPPHIVEPLVDEEDFSKVIGRRITEKYPHPTRLGESMTIIDEYTAKERVRLIQRNGVTTKRQVFKNLIGRVPVVLIPNVRGADEEFGRPEGEALVPMLQAYGEIMDAALKGNIRQGRPTPVMSKMGTAEQVQLFWEKYGREEKQTLDDGTVETTTVIDFDPDQLVTLPGDAEFDWKSPGSFVGDTEKLLGLLFYLMLQHTEIPEFVWGNAIASSKASAEAQMPPFMKWIEKRRGWARGWLLEIMQIVVGYLSVINPAINVRADVVLQWADLTDQDGRLTLDAIKLALENGLITRELALSLMPLDVEDPAAAVADADKEAEERQAAEDERMEAAIDRLANAPESADNGDQPDQQADAQEQPPDQLDRRKAA